MHEHLLFFNKLLGSKQIIHSSSLIDGKGLDKKLIGDTCNCILKGSSIGIGS
jgi:hypothetical protein